MVLSPFVTVVLGLEFNDNVRPMWSARTYIAMARTRLVVMRVCGWMRIAMLTRVCKAGRVLL